MMRYLLGTILGPDILKPIPLHSLRYPLCMYVCICVCVCMYVYTYTYVHTYIYMYICQWRMVVNATYFITISRKAIIRKM